MTFNPDNPNEHAEFKEEQKDLSQFKEDLKKEKLICSSCGKSKCDDDCMGMISEYKDTTHKKTKGKNGKTN